GQRDRVARPGNHVVRAEYARLFDDFAADLRKCEAISGWIEPFQASGILDRLQRDATHARLLESIVNYLADFAVVQAFAQSGHQRRRNVVLVQPLECAFAYAAQIAAPQIEQRFALERIELQIYFEIFNLG